MNEKGPSLSCSAQRGTGAWQSGLYSPSDRQWAVLNSAESIAMAQGVPVAALKSQRADISNVPFDLQSLRGFELRGSAVLVEVREIDVG